MANETDIAVLGVVLDPKGVVTGVRVAKKELKNLQTDVEKTGTGFERMAKRVGAALAVFMGFRAIGGMMSQGVREMIEFESAFVGVEKVIDATAAQLDELKQQFEGLQRLRPENIVELMGMGQAAGQLGVATENIIQFTETMANLAIATNVSGEAGAIAIKRLLDLTNASVTDVDRFGSALVGLGNDAAAMEDEILEMASGVGRSTAIFGLSAQQVLGFSTALKETGQAPMLAGGAIGRLAVKLNQIAKEGGAARFVINDLSKALGEGKDIMETFQRDAGTGMQLFFEALGRSGADVSITLRDMGLDATEMIKVIGPLALQWQNLNKRVDQANQFWDDNVAATQEAQKALGTLGARVGVLRNNWDQLLRVLAQSKQTDIVAFVEGITVGLQRINQGDSGQGIKMIGATLTAAGQKFVVLLLQGITSLSFMIKQELVASFQHVWNQFEAMGLKAAGSVFKMIAEKMPDTTLLKALPFGAGDIFKALDPELMRTLGSGLAEEGHRIGAQTIESVRNGARESVRETIGKPEAWILDLTEGWMDQINKNLDAKIELNRTIVLANEWEMRGGNAPQLPEVPTFEPSAEDKAADQNKLTAYEHFGRGWETAASEFQDSMALIQSAGEQTFQTLDTGFSGLVDSFVEDLELSKQDIGEFFSYLGKQIMKIMLMQLIIRPILGAIGLPGFGGGGGAPMADPGTFAGGFGGSSPVGSGGDMFGGLSGFEKFHTGGIVGAEGTLPKFHSGGIVGVEGSYPKFHSGGVVQGHGERTITALAGEGVFTKGQMAALGPAGGVSVPINVSINVNNNGGTAGTGGTADSEMEQQRRLGEMLGDQVSMKIRQEVGRMLIPGGEIYRLARPNG